MPVPDPVEVPLAEPTAMAIPQESAEALPSPTDLQEAVLRARALLPEPLDAPSPLP
jgi:hypothetical protein